MATRGRPLLLGDRGPSLQGVHPDVVWAPEGFAGHRYWMAFTPYAWGDDRVENPSVRVSDDGLTWRLPDGAPDPLVPAPADPDSHHADTDLVLYGRRLHLIFMTADKRTGINSFSLMSSADGRAWTPPVVCYCGQGGVSPAVVVREGVWRVWSIHVEGTGGGQVSRLLLREGPSLTALGAPVECELPMPGRLPWHLDVQWTGARYEAMVSAYPSGRDHDRTALFHATSADGRRFLLSRPQAILAPSLWGWDNKFIYRSTFLALGAERYRIWYSAASWGRFHGIGYLEGTLDDLRPSAAPAAPQPPWLRRLTADLAGLARYGARTWLPPRLAAGVRGGLRAIRRR